MQPNNEITSLVQELIDHGRDADELNYWVSIYDDLDQDKKDKLLANLQKELEIVKSK
jgi:hypothetical protein